MARQLTARGEEVALVALLDAPAPGYGRRMKLGQVIHAFYGVILRNLWPYVRDYFYLLDVSGNRDQGRSRLRSFLGRLRSLRTLVQGAGIAAAVPPQIRAMVKAMRDNSKAMSRYSPGPYPGRAVLFKTAADDLPGDPTQGWGELAQGGVEVKEIPGNHMTLLREPHVRGLAAALRESLEEAGS
jgi:thioesterase domain-containing protein